MSTFKIAILGDKDVGKSTFVARHATGHFMEADTLPVSNYKVSLTTNYGVFNLEFTSRFARSDAAICMFDLTSPRTMEYLKKKLPGLSGLFFVICGTKVDSPDLVVTSKIFRRNFLDTGAPLFEISSKSNYNYDKPFLAILRHLTGNEDLVCH